MKYSVKNGNYYDFKKYSENKIGYRSYFIPFPNYETIENTNILNERYSSPSVQVLSGKWEFMYYENESKIPNVIDTEFLNYDVVEVPSTWQHTGYEKPYYLNTRYQFKPNPPEIPYEETPVGIYFKKFDVDDIGLSYTLSFLGVAGCLDLFVNGEYIGYSEGSHNTAEFELSNLKEKDNEIVLVNHKWSNGTYLECQDFFRNNGIFRDVLLYKNKENRIFDYHNEIKYLKSEKYNCDLSIDYYAKNTGKIIAKIFDEKNEISKSQIDILASAELNRVNISLPDLDVEQWNAEKPKLYCLELVIYNGNDISEIIRRPIGFKHIEIRNNVFNFNDKRIKLLGVNHHDTNCKTGYVLTAEELEKDVKIFKEYNINCVRTSHYPPDPIFIDLCDYYGVYVIDEADIEAHGCQTELHKFGACSHNPQWKDRYWDRVHSMYQRDKNHPSITMWSLGNESWGYSNQDYCYEQLKKLSPIPIHYENVIRTKRFAYDVISEMYPWVRKVKKISSGRGMPKKFYKKPYFMCEYAHAMGLGAGDLDQYVSEIYKGKNMLGGCIWEFVDHAIYHSDGPYKYTYGGDHGELKHDYNFCVDGLFFPDRTPHAGAWQMKNVYNPIQINKIEGEKISFISHKVFETSVFKVEWQFLCDMQLKDSGEFEIEIAPNSITTKSINLPKDGSHRVLVLRYFEGNRLLGTENHVIKDENIILDLPKNSAPKLSISEKKWFIDFDNGTIVFDTTKGNFERYIFNGKDLFNTNPVMNSKGISFDVFRAPIDNDMYIKKAWTRLALDTENVSLSKTLNVNNSYKLLDDSIVIGCKYKLSTIKKNKIIEVNCCYTIFGDGSIKVDAKVTDSKIFVYAPRFGIIFEMPKEYKNVKYYGLGPYQNVSDFNKHCIFGNFDTTVDNMSEKYIKPQESSMRSEVRKCQITDENGVGIEVFAIEKPFIFSASHNSSQQIAKAEHQEDLKSQDTTLVHIDSYMLGAGSAACGPPPSKGNYVHNLRKQEISVIIKPIQEGN